MLIRSDIAARVDAEPTTATYALFGPSYTATDPGATFSLSGMSQSDRTRVRRVVETTVFIRNRMSDWASVFVN